MPVAGIYAVIKLGVPARDEFPKSSDRKIDRHDMVLTSERPKARHLQSGQLSPWINLTIAVLNGLHVLSDIRRRMRLPEGRIVLRNVAEVVFLADCGYRPTEEDHERHRR